MKIAIINLADESCACTYEDSAPNQSKYGGPWGDPSHTIHLQIPDGVVTAVTTAWGSIPVASIQGSFDGTTWSVVEV